MRIYFAILFFIITTITGLSFLKAENNLITETKVYDTDSTFRFVYYYNTDGKMTLETKYFLQDKNWVRLSQNEWLYNGSNCTAYHESKWKNSEWTLTYSIDFAYISNLLRTETYQATDNGTSTNLKKNEYEYTDTLVKTKREYSWNGASWVRTIETSTTYLTGGKPDSIQITRYDNGVVSSKYLTIHTYNASGWLTTKTVKTFDTPSGSWINYKQTKYYYTGGGQVSSQRNKEWNVDLALWENTDKIDYIYNTDKSLQLETYQKWNTMYWEDDSRYQYIYDSNGILTDKLLLIPIYNEWRKCITIAYSDFKNNKANLMESRYNFWGGETDELTVSDIPYMFNESTKIQRAKKIEISYLPVDTTDVSTVNDKNNLTIIAYPNPSDGMFYFDAQFYNAQTWNVTDMKGKIVQRDANRGYTTGVVDLTDLPKGIYILNVKGENQSYHQKLVKK